MVSVRFGSPLPGQPRVFSKHRRCWRWKALCATMIATKSAIKNAPISPDVPRDRSLSCQQEECIMDEELTFGQWLRTSRRGHDLTQAELARKVGCAAGTIRKLESDELRPSREIAARIAAQFAVPAAEGEAFVAFARGLADLPLRQRRALRPSATTVARGAPPCEPSQPLPLPATPLIGREQEVAAVRQQLSQPAVRLVTLTGPGGIGKTRLALQVAAELLNEFANGVWFIDLAPLSTPQLVAARIATTLGVQVAGDEQIVVKLKGYLSEKQLLLVLDNFEQVVEAATLVADLLQAVPGLKVLVTSRVALHLSSEREVPVPPLSVPDPQHLPALASLTQYEAVRLFIERAQAVKPDFLVTNANALAVAEICVHLDGLPLAIELAAARSKLFTPEALLRRLEHRLAVLTGGARDLPVRQQTIRATIDWSYHLLDLAEQRLFRRLAVFEGGWTVDAAEAVCDADGDLGLAVLDGLQALLDKSLVQQEEATDGDPHFMMLETIREYAVERLRASGEAEHVRRQHARYYLALVEASAPTFRGPEQTVTFDRLNQEHDNLRAALHWTVARAEAEQALRLASALARFWHIRGHTSEGRRWLEAALALDGPVAPALRARALMAAGAVSYQETAQFEEALRLFRELGDKRNMTEALSCLADVAWTQSDLTRSTTLFQESLDLFRELGDADGMGWALGKLGWLALNQGAYARGSGLLEESLRLGRMLGSQQLIVHALNYMGFAAMEQR